MTSVSKAPATQVVLFDWLHDGSWDRISLLSGIRSNLKLESINPCPGRIVIFCGEIDRHTISRLQSRVKTHVYTLGDVYKNYKTLQMLREYRNQYSPNKRSWAAAWSVIIANPTVFPFLQKSLKTSCEIVNWDDNITKPYLKRKSPDRDQQLSKSSVRACSLR